MMWQHVLYILLIVVICACGRGARDRVADNSGAGETSVSPALELPLPAVPHSIVDPCERTDYVLSHFWDSLDFSDTLRTHNPEFVQRNVARFLKYFPEGSGWIRSHGIASLLDSTANDPVAFGLVTDALDRYLDDPNSPLRNEEYYILFLEKLLSVPGLSDDDRVRPANKLAIAKKNRPGSDATDFSYLDRDGKKRTLRTTTPGKPLLLIFYDPECDHCSEILRQVHDSRVIADRVRNGALTVLAIYTEGKRQLWDDTKAGMPRDWIVGYDLDNIVDRDLYAVPAMPIMYLLDPDKKVLLKDAPQTLIESELESPYDLFYDLPYDLPRD